MLTIRSTHLGPDDRGNGARIRATARHNGRARSLTISYPFDGPDAGGSETYAIPAARLASRIMGRNVGPSELMLTLDLPASFVYEIDDTRPVDPDAPVLGEISRQYGPAGAVVYTVHVRYPSDGDDGGTVSFHGSTYGASAPVVMVTPGNPGGTFVTDPHRFGTFGESWVRRFFGGAA